MESKQKIPYFQNIIDSFIELYIKDCFSIIVVNLNYKEKPLMIINHNLEQRAEAIKFITIHAVTDNTILKTYEYSWNDINSVIDSKVIDLIGIINLDTNKETDLPF